DNALDGDVVDGGLLPQKVLSTCEFTLTVIYGDEVETFEGCSLNAAAANHVEKVASRSSLVHVTATGDSGSEHPLVAISGEEGNATISLSGGSDGSVSALSPSDYMGEDNGPGKRTGIQAFIDN